MSASSDIQGKVATLLAAEGALPVRGFIVPVPKDQSAPEPGLPIIKRRDKELVSEIEMAANQFGICLHVMPPLPTHFLQGNPFVFYDHAEIRVRILEFTQLNASGVDGYELLDAIGLALHWQTTLDGMLAHPLQLAARPQEMVEDKEKRIIDVVFDAQYQINPAEV